MQPLSLSSLAHILHLKITKSVQLRKTGQELEVVDGGQGSELGKWEPAARTFPPPRLLLLQPIGAISAENPLQPVVLAL